MKSFFLERMERELDQPEYGKNAGEVIVLNECLSLLFPLCLHSFVCFSDDHCYTTFLKIVHCI